MGLSFSEILLSVFRQPPGHPECDVVSGHQLRTALANVVHSLGDGPLDLDLQKVLSSIEGTEEYLGFCPDPLIPALVESLMADMADNVQKLLLIDRGSITPVSLGDTMTYSITYPLQGTDRNRTDYPVDTRLDPIR